MENVLEILDGLDELTQMLETESISSGNIKQFKALILAGSTIKEAQSKIVYDNSF